MTYPKHEDHRGYFQELAKVKDIKHPIEQVGVFTINPGKTRGDHYHKKLVETFIVLEGECTVTQTWFTDTEKNEETKILKEGDSVTFYPGTQHKFYSDKWICKVLALASRDFNPDEPDVFKF